MKKGKNEKIKSKKKDKKREKKSRKKGKEGPKRYHFLSCSFIFFHVLSFSFIFFHVFSFSFIFFHFLSSVLKIRFFLGLNIVTISLDRQFLSEKTIFGPISGGRK